jgi:serine/alanine adding enzyme
MTVRIVRRLERDAWSEAVAGAPNGNVFHTPEMADVFALAAGHRPSLWAAVDDDDRVLALMTPVQVASLGGLLSTMTTRSIAYGGVLMANDPRSPVAVRAMLEAYAASRDRRALFTEIRNLDDSTPWKSTFERTGYRYDAHLNYLISLDRPADDVLQAMGRRTRHHIRRAIRRGNVEVVEITKLDELDDWYATLRLSYVHAGVPVGPRSLFAAAWQVLRPAGMLHLYTARIDGVTAACSAELTYRDRVYGWYAGTDRRYSASVPSELLMWRVIEWGVANGYRTYDFGGAGRPGEPYGVRDFKAKFGGEMVEYGRYLTVHAPHRLAISQRGYGLYQRVVRRGRVPESVRPGTVEVSSGG